MRARVRGEAWSKHAEGSYQLDRPRCLCVLQRRHTCTRTCKDASTSMDGRGALRYYHPSIQHWRTERARGGGRRAREPEPTPLRVRPSQVEPTRALQSPPKLPRPPAVVSPPSWCPSLRGCSAPESWTLKTVPVLTDVPEVGQALPAGERLSGGRGHDQAFFGARNFVIR